MDVLDILHVFGCCNLAHMMMLCPSELSGLVGQSGQVAAVILQLKNDIEDIIAGHGILAYVSLMLDVCYWRNRMRNCDCIEG